MGTEYKKVLRGREPSSLSRGEWAETHGDHRRNLLHLAAAAGGPEFRGALAAYLAVRAPNSGLNHEPHVVMDAQGLPPLHLAACRFPQGDNSGVLAWLEVWPHGPELGIRSHGRLETVLHRIAWWSALPAAREYCAAIASVYTSVHCDHPGGGARAIQLAAARLNSYCANAAHKDDLAATTAAEVFEIIARSAAAAGAEWTLLEDTHVPPNYTVDDLEISAALTKNPRLRQHGLFTHAGSCSQCSPRVQLATTCPAQNKYADAKRWAMVELVDELTADYRARQPKA